MAHWIKSYFLRVVFDFSECLSLLTKIETVATMELPPKKPANHGLSKYSA